MSKETLSFVTPPRRKTTKFLPKNYKISSAISYNFKLALTARWLSTYALISAEIAFANSFACFWEMFTFFTVQYLSWAGQAQKLNRLVLSITKRFLNKLFLFMENIAADCLYCTKRKPVLKDRTPENRLSLRNKSGFFVGTHKWYFSKKCGFEVKRATRMNPVPLLKYSEKELFSCVCRNAINRQCAQAPHQAEVQHFRQCHLGHRSG